MITKKTTLISAIIIIVALSYFGYRQWSVSYENIYTVARGPVTQKVSETGRLISAKDFDLSYGVGGEISVIYAKVGDEVKKGEALAELDKKELEIQLRQARARRSSAQAKLNQLLAGATSEDVQVYETAVANAETAVANAETAVQNAQTSVADAEINLKNVREKAAAEMQKDYDEALSTLQKSVSIAKTALLTLSDIQIAHFNKSDQDSFRLAEAKATAAEALLGAQNAGQWTTEYISILDGGVWGAVQGIGDNPSYEDTDATLAETISALQEVASALNTVPVNTALTATEKTNLASEKNNVNTEIITISDKQQAIAVQKVTNQNDIDAARERVNAAESTLRAAEGELKAAQGALAKAKNQLALKKASPRKVDTAVFRSQIRDAQGAIELLQKRLRDAALRAPIDGVVAKVAVEKGERVAPNQAVVSLISEGRYELEVYIAEENITAVSVNLPIEFTLDAFPKNQRFKAKVRLIEPTATIIEDEVYYKVKGAILEDIPGVLEGMSADVDIIIDGKEDVVRIPAQAVKQAEGRRFVWLVKSPLKKEVRWINAGLSGGGWLEVTNGLQEGEQILAN